jgi:hypothetical protein
MDQESAKKKQLPFRFLKPEEYAALTPEEKAKYLEQAIKAAKGEVPLDVPDKGEQH